MNSKELKSQTKKLIIYMDKFKDKKGNVPFHIAVNWLVSKSFSDADQTSILKLVSVAKTGSKKKKPLKKKVASYKDAIDWIAHNDDPECLMAADVSCYISTILVATIFGCDPSVVSADIIRKRLSAKGHKV